MCIIYWSQDIFEDNNQYPHKLLCKWWQGNDINISLSHFVVVIWPSHRTWHFLLSFPICWNEERGFKLFDQDQYICLPSSAQKYLHYTRAQCKPQDLMGCLELALQWHIHWMPTVPNPPPTFYLYLCFMCNCICICLNLALQMHI